jgi:putative flippase GtrA
MGFLNNLSMRKQVTAFILGGVISFLVNIFVTFILVNILGLWYLFSAIIGAIVSWTTFFLFNRSITFSHGNLPNLWGSYIKNMSFYLASSPIGFFFIYFLTSVLGMHYLLSVTLVAGGMSMVSFFFSKIFVFNHRNQ